MVKQLLNIRGQIEIIEFRSGIVWRYGRKVGYMAGKLTATTPHRIRQITLPRNR